MSFVVAQLGARMHYAVPSIFEKSGMLERLYTDLLVSDFGFVQAARIPCVRQLKAIRQVAGRTAGETPLGKTHTFPLFGLQYWARLRLLGRHRSPLGTYLWAGREFCKRVTESGFASADSVYTFNSAALEILEAAKRKGFLSVLEQTIAPLEVEREILEHEIDRYSKWEPLPRVPDLQAEFESRERAELNLADVVVCASEFVRTSIQKTTGAGGKCVVVPYGVDNHTSENSQLIERGRGGKLNVLFVGAVTLRKGVQYLAAAAASLGSIAQFSVLGTAKLSEYGISELQKRVRFLGAVPRNEVKRQMAAADVFILPSLCEGSATVCYEALAAGLPVITTDNAGSVVRHGVDGYIIPIRSADAIVDCVSRLASDRNLLQWMSDNAGKRAAEYTTEAYGRRLLSALKVKQTVC